MKGRRGGKNRSAYKGVFDPEDVNRVKHSRMGVWDLYEEKQPTVAYVPVSSRLERYAGLVQGLPYIWRMIKDVAQLKDCWVLLAFYVLVEILLSLLPAVSLWYSGQMLKIVQTAVDTRTVDKQILLQVALGRTACALASRLLGIAKSRLSTPLNRRIKHYYSIHIFNVMARLDVPTSENQAIQRQIEATMSNRGRSVAWDTVVMTAEIASAAVKLMSQLSVLINVLQDQRDGPLLATLSLSQSVFQFFNARVPYQSVWAATTRNEEYIRMEGLKRVVNNPEHRKEIVAGNMSEYLTMRYRQAVQTLGDDAGDFFERQRQYWLQDRINIPSLIQQPLRELPQIVFTLRAVQYPASIPLSLASLNLIQQTSQAFSFGLVRFFDQTGSISDQVSSVRKLYDIANIQNEVRDGNRPFPDDQQNLRNGISVEFRDVSFQYPGTEKYALRHTSFSIGPGHLCVIVGTNGSGKSTILKLISRIYDPTEGRILIDGQDIKSLKLDDLRRAITVLFQDYTHFPLSIKENIALGNPELADDEDKILEAARLGGAEEFVNQLPDGFDTYLNRPVRDYYSPLPEGTKTLFGRPVDYSRLRGAGGMSSVSATPLSGGQMQRLAVARTFMRSLVSDSAPSRVGLLLFDEPSASLDPAAEHDLFERLRQLRGNKTMIFSSHRFGNLTRHADLILYMNDAEVLESGTHDALLKADGAYARIWNLQAQAFIS